jgi:hypothetical protein
MRKRSLSILALILAIVFTGYVIFSFWEAETATGEVLFDVHSGPIITGGSDTAFGGLFETVQVNDTLPYYIYKRQADSIKNILDKRDRENKSELMGGMSLGAFGVYTTTSPQQEQRKEQFSQQYFSMMNKVQAKAALGRETNNNIDSMRRIDQESKDSMKFYQNEYNRRLRDLEKNDNDLHYFGLIGYTLPEKTRFFMQNGTFNLVYVKWDSISKENHLQYGHYERKQIPVRYSASKELIYIPVSKNQYNVLNTIAIMAGFALLFLIVYFFVGLPLQILINISKGKAFDESNTRRFTIMYRIALGTVLVYLVMPFILRLAFHKMIPHDFIRPAFWELLWGSKWLLLVTIVLFLIGKAFQKGNSLQREQDLTI